MSLPAQLLTTTCDVYRPFGAGSPTATGIPCRLTAALTATAGRPGGSTLTWTHTLDLQPGADVRDGCSRTAGPAGWPAPPLPIDYAKALSFPMYGNDRLGDCMYAAACHADNTFTGNIGTESTFDEATLERDYERLSGGDNGLDEGTLIQGWKAGLAGVKAASILDALDIDTTDPAT